MCHLGGMLDCRHVVDWGVAVIVTVRNIEITVYHDFTYSSHYFMRNLSEDDRESCQERQGAV